MSRPRRAVAIAAAVCLAAIPTVTALGTADAEAPPAAQADTSLTDPTFARINVDTAISGASFTSVGTLFGTEQNIVTSGYGALNNLGRPVGGGSLQVYRPGATLDNWTKVSVFGPEAEIVFPNAATIDDVDGDGDNDIILPSGYFFGTEPDTTQLLTGAITWWENTGAGTPFERHDVISGQAGSYHGVQFVDLDGDGKKDLLSVSEEARAAGDLVDDTIEMHFFKGAGDGSFAAPVVLSGVGGSQPIVHDVDGDDDLDIISSQYFHLMNTGAAAPSFLWLENVNTDSTLTSADFTTRTIATFMNTSAGRGLGMGFQIRPVPGFRGPGTLSWIGTNHVNRCTLPGPLAAIPEQVVEFIPTSDIRAPWTLKTLSDAVTAPPACPADYRNYAEPTFSDAITARFGYGQGAPGVFGYGDIDGDGDVDLAVSGDGDRRLWWIEKKADGGTILHRLTGTGEHFGQAGGAVVVDLDGNGTSELVFSSFDQNTLAIWTPNGTKATPASPVTPTPTTPVTPVPTAPPVKVSSKLTVTKPSVKVKAGTKKTWKVRLTGAQGGPKRIVKVTFDPKKGKTTKLGSVRLGPAGGASQKGTFTWRPKKPGTLIFVYAGTTVSTALSDTTARDTAKVVIKK